MSGAAARLHYTTPHSAQRAAAAQSPFGTAAIGNTTQSPVAAHSPYAHTPLLGHGRVARRATALPHPVAAAAAGVGGPNNSARASSAASASPSPPALLPLPPSEMSCHALLSLHLDDYVQLVDGLLHSLDPALAGAQAAVAHAGAAAVSAAGASGSSGSSAATSSDVWLQRLLRKDALLQESVQALLAHQRLQRRLQAQYEELAALDATIVGFCSQLGQLEQSLIHASTDPRTLRPLSAAGPVRQQAFSMRSLLVLSEKLGRMSLPAADHIEKKVSINENVCRPPAPLDKYMAHSLLHCTTEELHKLVMAEQKNREEAAAKEAQLAAGAGGTGAEGADGSAMSDVDASSLSHMPGSLAALGRQESLPSASTALPSFAELAASAGATAPMGTPQMWRQDSAHRPMPSSAPVALDLDLESSDEEDDD